MRIIQESTTRVGFNLYAPISKFLLISLAILGFQISSVKGQVCVGTEITIDFSTKPDGTPFQTGEVITDQYSSLGVTISSRLPSGGIDTDNPMVVFNSAVPNFGANIPGDPGNGDPDLGTPSVRCPGETGPGVSGDPLPAGVNNCDSLGNIMIFEESFQDLYNNDSIANGNLSTDPMDADWLGAADGFDDSPDDNVTGGILRITFANAFDITQLGFVDDAAGEFTLKFESGPDQTLNILAGADNDTSVVDVSFLNVIEIDFEQQGSGALSFIKFCDRVTGEIGDQLYIDNDGSGTFNAGDAPIANVDVTLTAPGGGTTIVSTDALGNYLFENLGAGTYEVEVDIFDPEFPVNTYATVDDDGLATLHTSTVTLVGDSDSRLDQDFGYQTFPSSCETEYIAAILDWDVESWTAGDLTDTFTFGSTEATVTFAITGAAFDPGQPSTALLAESNTPVFDISNYSQANATGDNTTNSDDGTINVFFEQEVTTVTFTFSRSGNNGLLGYLGDILACTPIPATLGNLAFIDYNNNGIQDGSDSGLPGVDVVLLDGAGDPATDINGDLVSSQMTGVNGEYLFTNLGPGNYIVEFSAEADQGVTRTTAEVGGNDAIDSDAATGNGRTGVITLEADDDDLSVDAGYVGAGDIGDQLYIDIDNNGAYDPAIDSVIANVTVTLGLPGGGTITDVTDANGIYLFQNLPIGDYTVTVNTTDPDFPDGVTNSVDPNGGNNNTSEVTLVLDGAGPDVVDNLNQDFGYAGAASVGNQLYEDVDGNGMYDALIDNPLGGVTVSLKLPTGAIITTDTDGAGNYTFNNLTPGDYMVIVDQGDLPAGLVNTVDPDGSDDSMSSLTLGVDEINLLQDFGYVSPVSIGNLTFIDYNGDGLQTADDSIGGVVVTLVRQDGGAILDLDGNAVGTMTTAAGTGLYLFDNLPPGSYGIQFGTLTDYNRTTADAGSNDQIDSDANATTGSSAFYTLNSGDDTLVVDAGYVGTGVIGDQFFVDVDGDGVYTPGTDEPIGGVEVTLTLPNGQTLTTTTDATDGTYSFTELAPGDYSVGYDAADVPNLTQTVEGDGTPNNMSVVTLTAGETKLE